MEKKYHLGGEKKLFDAELSSIDKATEITGIYTAKPREIRRVWIFSDTREPVRRIRTTKAEQRQDIVVWTRRGILKLQGTNVKVTVQCVLGHVEVPENDNTN